jgi:hypothetical protein
MKRNHPASEGAFVYIEQEGRDKFKIQSDQLEKIGAQLRGPRHFPIFQSIILPIIITLTTLIFTSLFQYVSWLNTVKLQDATDVASNAERAYEEAADAIGTRQYSMFVFLPTLRELVKAKAKVEAAARARVEAAAKVIDEVAAKASDEAAAKAGGENGKRDAKRSPQPKRVSTRPENRKLAETYATTVLRPEETKDMEISLLKATLNVEQQRFTNYYKRLKL